MSIQDETWDRITTLADIEKLEEWAANDSTYRSALEKHLRETCVALRRAWLERDQARAERDEARALAEKPRTLEWGPDEGNMTWDAAMKLAASKGDGWRLPTVQELVAQFDYDKSQPAPGFRRTFYWASSPYDSHRAWGVNFYGGGSDSYGVGHSIRVRCVRWAGDGSTDRQIDSSRARYAAELRALADRIERGEQ